MNKTSTILAISSGLFFGQAQAEIETEFHVGYNSEYIYRGVDLGDDAFEYGLAVAGESDCGLVWRASIWSISPDGTNTNGSPDELDINAEVEKDLGFGSLAAGFTAYTYDSSAAHPAGDDSEIYVGLSTQQAGIDLGLTVFYGTDGALDEQVLLEGTVGYKFTVSEKVSGKIGIAYGYMLDEGKGGYSNDDGEVYASAILSFDIALSEDITLSPYVKYIEGEDKRIGNAAHDGVIGGASVRFRF